MPNTSVVVTVTKRIKSSLKWVIRHLTYFASGALGKGEKMDLSDDNKLWK